MQTLADEAPLGGTQAAFAERAAQFETQIRPLLASYCLDCHASDVKEGQLDLERFASHLLVRRDLKPWQALIVQLEAGEMPPKDEKQPSAAERQQLIEWTKRLLEDEVRARRGDPGRVPLRRLSNTEYNNTIRELTGVDLQPAREFPADGAAGEGFTNAAESLSMSPGLMSKYLDAAKQIAAHAVLLPEGFRFSKSATRRDQTDENVAKIRAFYAPFVGDQEGRLAFEPYLAALVRHRDALLAGRVSTADVAAREKLNAKYLQILWQTFNSQQASFPLSQLQAHWHRATEADIPSFTQQVQAWQTALWKVVPIGSYRFGDSERQMANDLAMLDRQTLRYSEKPQAGEDEVILYLTSKELTAAQTPGLLVLKRPRFEGSGEPLLLADYMKFGAAYEVDSSALFAQTAKYLDGAAKQAVTDSKTTDELARELGLDAVWLQRWIELLAVQTGTKADGAQLLGRTVAPVELKHLNEPTPENQDRPAIRGWKRAGSDLPVLVSNASDKTELVPGTIPPHQIAVHPLPNEFVAVVWKSPLAGELQLEGQVVHAHPACGNGVAWWLEWQAGERTAIIAEGAVDLGQEAAIAPLALRVAPGDELRLAIDARDANHVCDLTQINFSIQETGGAKRVWDLAADLAETIRAGNPHADRYGNPNVWSAVEGPSSARPRTANGNGGDNGGLKNILAQWRSAALDPDRQEQANWLANQFQALLTAKRPADNKGGQPNPDQALYDQFVGIDGVLLRGLDLTRLGNAELNQTKYGLAKDRFGKHPLDREIAAEDLVVPLGEVVELRLPTALLREREFVVEARVETTDDSSEQKNAEAAPAFCAARVTLQTGRPAADAPWDGQGPLLVSNDQDLARDQVLAGFAELRKLFPKYLCFPHVIPTDEVVCLKTFHREDESLRRLFLTEDQAAELGRLWSEQRFISHFPTVENDYLPLFIGFVTQDQSAELVAYFQGQREPFAARAAKFEAEFDAAATSQLAQLNSFAALAYRRPLQAGEADELAGLYRELRKKEMSHDDAFRNVLARVLISPALLMRVEQAPRGTSPGTVNDWELASRLSYFLWSAPPDEALRQASAQGDLHNPEVLASQMRRMLQDGRTRALAMEFGTQWIHVRGFDQFDEKNEKLFPTFDDPLRQAIYQESILFFQHLFQQNRPAHEILDADYTFLNETLARHYGIPNVTGDQWHKIDGVRKFGRGGILGLASVQAKQSGASRTSPVLRGNWVFETLLGQKLPLPPANVPQLPEAETGNAGLTMRELVEKHVQAAECAVCHQKIDYLGFALEAYDPIGRRRDTDLGGLPIDSKATPRDGPEFDGIDGLRSYLLAEKRDVFLSVFCRRLLGYSLGRETALSDRPLIDAMMDRLNEPNSGVWDALLTIVQSPQFRMIRGADFEDFE